MLCACRGDEGRRLTWPRWIWEGFIGKQKRRDSSAWRVAVDEDEISQGFLQAEGRSRGMKESEYLEAPR